MSRVYIPLLAIVLCLMSATVSFHTRLSAETLVIDANYSYEEALANLNEECPSWIKNNQALIEVYYLGYDDKLHKGQLVADCRHALELQAIFKKAYDTKTKIYKVVPIVAYEWDDFASMRADNSSAFNYRTVPFKKSLSNHAYGWAIDINPRENPYYTGDKVYPKGAHYDKEAVGTLYKGHPLVSEFIKHGWSWGGNWKSVKDYQHFQKKLSKEEAAVNKKFYPWPYKK